MANKFWARKDSKYKVVSSAPSVNLTQVGNAIVPVPYPVNEKLSKAVSTADDVLVNGKPTYIHGSDTTSVKGDGKGSKGGVKSGTVEAKSEPIKAMASPTVKANKQHVVREGDLQMMQGGNTIGKITCSESASVATIKDDGSIQGETLPPDLDSSSAQKIHQSASQQPAAQSMPGATKPTAGGSSGGLGASTGSPVMLHTGQLHYVYDYMGINLAGAIEISPSLIYLSNSQYRGFFGRNRRFFYEKQFVALNDTRCRLYTVDGREFDFVLENQQYIDIGDLGVDISHDGIHWILNYFDSTTEIYKNNRLLEIRDANKNSLSFDYKPNGALRTIHNSSGASLHFEYNSRHCVNRMYDHSKRVWQYSYDGHDNLIEIEPPAGRSEHYTYQPLNNISPTDKQNIQWPNLIDVSDSVDNKRLTVDYDQNSRVSAYSQAQESYRYIYHKHKLVEKIDCKQRSTLYGLDEYGLIKAITAVDGSTQREEYDSTTRTAKIITNEGDPRIEKYDERHRILSVVNGCCAGCGQEIFYTYLGSNPNPIVINDDGKETLNTYDDCNNILSTTNPDGKVISYSYNEHGLLTKLTDVDGHTYNYEYNEQNLLVRVTDPRDASYIFVYDSFGRKVRRTDPGGDAICYAYDGLNNIVQRKDAMGQTTKFSYNEDNQLERLTDSLSNTTCYFYNQFDQLVSQVNSDQSRRSLRYNQEGLLNFVRREDGSELKFVYDDRKNITELIARQKTDDSCSRPFSHHTFCQINHHKIRTFYDGFTTLPS